MAIEYLCSCYDKGYCNGTRERDVCSCGGDERYCSFYPEKRKKALADFDAATGMKPIDIPEDRFEVVPPTMHDSLDKAMYLSIEISVLARTIHNSLFYTGKDDEEKPVREVRCANDQILAIIDQLRETHEYLNAINSKL